MALKIYIHKLPFSRELPFYKHLNKVLPTKHRGAKNVRKLFTSFEADGPHGKHLVLVHEVAQMSLRDMDTIFMKGRGYDESFVRAATFEALKALDFLHREVEAVHTGRCI